MRLLSTSLLVLLYLSGCAVSDRVVYTDSEGVVPESFFSTVKKKKTDKDWIVDNLGPPQAVDEVAELAFFTYHFAKSRYRKVSVLLVLNRGTVEEAESYYHVMLCNDVVERAWFDAYASVDTHRLSAKSRCDSEAR